MHPQSGDNARAVALDRTRGQLSDAATVLPDWRGPSCRRQNPSGEVLLAGDAAPAILDAGRGAFVGVIGFLSTSGGWWSAKQGRKRMASAFLLEPSEASHSIGVVSGVIADRCGTRQSYPLQIEQLLPKSTEETDAQRPLKRGPGRPKGRKNYEKPTPSLSPLSQTLQAMLASVTSLLGERTACEACRAGRQIWQLSEYLDGPGCGAAHYLQNACRFGVDLSPTMVPNQIEVRYGQAVDYKQLPERGVRINRNHRERPHLSSARLSPGLSRPA